MNLEKKIINIKAKIAIVGLGYVGLPLAYAFLEKKFQVTLNKFEEILNGN